MAASWTRWRWLTLLVFALALYVIVRAANTPQATPSHVPPPHATPSLATTPSATTPSGTTPSGTTPSGTTRTPADVVYP
jgi:hypothetical protein